MMLVDLEKGVDTYGGRRFGSTITVKSTGSWAQDTRRQSLTEVRNSELKMPVQRYEICEFGNLFIPAAGSDDPYYGYATAILYKQA